jgi:hypothetical protein
MSASASNYRSMAVKCRQRAASGEYPTSMINAYRIGAASGVLGMVRHYAAEPTEVMNMAERANMWLTCPDADVITMLARSDIGDANRYEQTADAMEMQPVAVAS